MSDMPNPKEVQIPDLQAPIEVHIPPKPAVTIEEDELQNPTPSEIATPSDVNINEDDVEEDPEDVFTVTFNFTIDPSGDQEAESKNSLGNDDDGKTGRIDLEGMFRQSAISAVDKWAELVLDQWLNSEDRRPGEFLSIMAWGDGAEFFLKAVPSTSPNEDVNLEVDAGVDEPAVLCDRGGKEEGQTAKETSPVG